ncbi:HlyD family type I secretion periplasmic adaptor subunit [Pseudomonas sp. P9_35]|nr:MULTISPECIES: HlyD family type I secretion periplasmic adaptor subunit [unclassified Pseudomonas]WPN66278.1 HlyD family type I secretion periplasmic adaptor subunit [Pseudomonas sp. P9_32]WPN71858.1 HlyD family type I secretion periplasmic adaptor subunit [Pseudomonas sp. P9_35]
MRPGDAAFMNDVQESLLSQTTPGSNRVLYLMALVFVASLIWAGFARVEEITQGEAKIISLSREQIIQSLEGGILMEMEVQEGDVVERGQVLLKIDPTRAHSSYREFFSKALGLKAAIVRLKAEAFDLPLEFDDMVRKEPEIIAQETRTYQAHKQALRESLDALDRSYKLSEREISLAKPLVAQGLMSEVEMLRMERQANEIKSQMIERRNKFRADANAELTRFEMELSQVTENLVGRADVVDRTTLTAPVRGTVKNVRVNTIGGVIQPGEHILEIVPLEEQLLIEGKIKPSDVAFLRPGLPAMVKITAYDFSVYGGLQGQVQYVSPDTLKDEQKAAAGRQDDTYYRVLVLTDNSTLDVGEKKLPIIPGMVATVEIRTGEKTILDYLLKPVLKAREAFRER